MTAHQLEEIVNRAIPLNYKCNIENEKARRRREQLKAELMQHHLRDAFDYPSAVISMDEAGNFVTQPIDKPFLSVKITGEE